MFEYLIVGLGLAGVSFCEQLEQNGKSYKVITDDSQQASLVAGGMYNPVVLRRFTMAWKAGEQMAEVTPFYAAMERKLQIEIDSKIPVLRRFASVEEQNLWFEACDKPGLNKFLSASVVQNSNPFIHAPFGLGEVKDTGRISTETLLKAYSKQLLKHEQLVQEQFEHSKLEILDDGFYYKGLSFKKLVFAEGYGLKQNPFFNYLPLNGTKGELLVIRAVGLNEQSIIKSSVFIVPYGDDLYLVGATYKWKDKTNSPTEVSKNELLDKLKTFLKIDFEVVDHVAGIRPTVTDRRPLVGRHPKHSNMYVLNGFGSRGVIIAPYASEQLYKHVEYEESLNPEINILRFENKFNTD